jgi:hypothetical protein
MDPGLGHMLRNGDADEKLEAIRAAAAAGQAAASLVPDLAALLLSDEFVHNISTAHAPLCERPTRSGTSALRRIARRCERCLPATA